MIKKKYQELMKWWATARSSLILHRRIKWAAVVLWGCAHIFGFISSITILADVSYFALVYSIWTAEGAAKVEVKEEIKEEKEEEEK